MEQTLQYFKNAQKILDANEFEDDEQYRLFMQNVFSEVDGLEYRLACNHDGSVVLEKILLGATPFQLRVFFEKIRDRFVEMCCHRYASHVIEQWIKLAIQHPQQNSQEKTDRANIPPQLVEQLADVSNLCIHNFVQLAEDEYGSHVIRLIIGLWTSDEGSTDSADNSANVVPGKEYIVQLMEQLLGLPKSTFSIEKAICVPQTSLVLQSLLPKLPREYQNHIFTLFFPHAEKLHDGSKPTKRKREQDTLLSISKHQTGSHFLESLIKTLDQHQWNRFWTSFVKPNFEKILFDARANFILQGLIDRCFDEGKFARILRHLEPYAERLITESKHGILIRLSQWTLQHEFAHVDLVMNLIGNAFHASSTGDGTDANLFLAILSLRPVKSSSVEAIQNGGCQLLQCLFSFPPKSIIVQILDGLVDYSGQRISRLALHTCGSRTIESFLVSQTIPESYKKKVIRNFLDEGGAIIMKLAVDRNGSHVLDKLFNFSPPSLQAQIADCLSQRLVKLQDNQYGRLVVKNCRLEEYIRDPNQWKQSRQRIERKRALLPDLIN